LLAGAGFGVYRFRTGQVGPPLPTAPVRKGEFLCWFAAEGRCGRSGPPGSYTPVVPKLEIGWLAVAGEEVKEGDVIVKFDPAPRNSR